MTSLTIKLPEKLKTELETEARLSGKSVSALVREAVEKACALSARRKKKQPTVLELLGDLCGKGDSGIPDLATNPKYMKGYGEWRR